jgi:hypothetical protein
MYCMFCHSFFVSNGISCNHRKKALIIVSWDLGFELCKLCHYCFPVSKFNAHKGQFYRIHVGIQSPEGFSSIHGILRRFSDFLKLSSDVS